MNGKNEITDIKEDNSQKIIEALDLLHAEGLITWNEELLKKYLIKKHANIAVIKHIIDRHDAEEEVKHKSVFDRKYLVNKWTAIPAAEVGNDEVVKFIINNYSAYMCNIGLCEAAVRGGSLDLLKWLRGRHFSWNYFTPSIAIRTKRYDIFLWAVDNGCDWYGTEIPDDLNENDPLYPFRGTYPSKREDIDKICNVLKYGKKWWRKTDYEITDYNTMLLKHFSSLIISTPL